MLHVTSQVAWPKHVGNVFHAMLHRVSSTEVAKARGFLQALLLAAGASLNTPKKTAAYVEANGTEPRAAPPGIVCLQGITCI
jgi:hypothetical protein